MECLNIDFVGPFPMEDMSSAIEHIYKMGGVKARKRGYIKKQLNTS
jgi:hypothetical protein